MVAIHDLTVGQVSGIIAAAVFVGKHDAISHLNCTDMACSPILSSYRVTYYFAWATSTAIRSRDGNCSILVLFFPIDFKRQATDDE